MPRRNERVYGHHGTTEERARAILKDGIQLSEQEWDWLGAGFYFWEDSPARAWNWCDERHPGQTACILDATISLQHCLNLADPDGVAILEPYFDLYVATYGESNVATLRETDRFRQLDCRIINYACERLRENEIEVHVVRGAFEEGSSIFDGGDGMPSSKLRKLSHVQLAVRNHQAIIDMRMETQRQGG